AGVAATRLLWALGFGADALYPVHVVCRNCPDKVAKQGERTPEGTRIDFAAIEREFKGHEIETSAEDRGWSWADLDLGEERAGGAPVAQRDALKLLVVLLQHGDNKTDQQRFVCRGGKKDDVASCADPFLMIHDLGMTFGRANLFNRATIGSVNLEHWSSTPIWKPGLRCVGNLPSSQTGTLADPSISGPGRQFLADRLARPTDRHLADLFTGARFADRPNGGGPVDAWLDAFKKKRDDIVAMRCN